MGYCVREGLSEFLVFVDLRAVTRVGAFRELLEGAARADRLDRQHADALYGSLIGGEGVYRSLSGAGVTCVHLAHSETILAIGRSKAGLDFGAPNGLPVRVVVLLLGREVGPLEIGWIDAPFVAGMLRFLCVEQFHSDVLAAREVSDVLDALVERCRSHFRKVLEMSGSLIELHATTREGALLELVAALADAGLFSKAYVNEIVEGLLERERQGSTGFGKGVAAPRVRSARLSEAIIAIGRSKRGVEFHSLDGALTYIVIPILAPKNAEEQKVVLENITFCYLANPTFRECVSNAEGLPDVLRAVDELWHDVAE